MKPEAGRELSSKEAVSRAHGATFLDSALWKELHAARGLAETAAAWLQLQCALIGSVRHAVVVLGAADEGPYAPVTDWPEGARASPGLIQTAEVAMAERRSIARQRGGDQTEPTETSHVAVPLIFASQLHGVIAFELDRTQEHDLARKMRELQWGVTVLEAAALREQPVVREKAEERLRTVLDNTVACLESDGYLMTASVLVNRLVSQFGAARVMLGEVGPKGVRVVALSGAAQVNLKANLVQAVTAAMQESVDQHRPVVFPQVDPADSRIHRAHQELAQGEGYRMLCTVPVYNQAQVTAALMMEREEAFSEEDVALLEQVAALCGPILYSTKLNDRSPVRVAKDSLLATLQALLGPRNAVLKAVSIMLLFVLLSMSFMQGQYRVRAAAVLEGAIERVVTAPYEGYVSRAPARPGDLVNEGQELAALEDKELRLDLTRWLSQKAQLERQYLEAMAQRERAGAQIFKAQIDQADAQISLLNGQISRSQIRAPFAGVVVAGDLSRSIGQPVERGEILFKVAPLEDYRVALSVDERDISYLQVGQRGELILASRPGVPMIMEVESVTPVASTEEGVNVFRIEATLLDSIADLRPGMTGTGKVEVGERRLIWIWTHRMFEWMRVFFWRWTP